MPSLFNNALAAARRRWQHRRHFARLRDWAFCLYDAQLRYAKRLPLPLRGRSWPIRLAGHPAPLELRLGSSDGFVLEEIFITEVYQPITRADLGDVQLIVDLGANAGFSLRLWLDHFPRARIIAAEPDAANVAAASRNLAAAGPAASRARLLPAAISDKPGQVYLDRSAEECAISITDRPDGQPVEAITLPMLLDRCQIPPDQPIDLLKVDIEGAEIGVFGDCSGWISRVRNLMIELHPPYTSQAFLDDLRRNGAADFTVEWTSETAGNRLLFLRRQPA